MAGERARRGKRARPALAKIALALPATRRGDVEQTRLFAPNSHRDAALNAQVGLQLETIRQSIQKKRKIHVQYADAQQRATQRTIWPMGLYFWCASWTLICWCETRKDYRHFRIDRMSEVVMTAESSREAQGRSLADFLANMRKQ